MPIIKAYISRGRSEAEKTELVNAIRDVTRQVLQIPERDGYVLINECDLGIDPILPQDRVFLEMILFPGRRKETKKRLLKDLAYGVGQAMGIPPTSVLIYVNEPPLENWGIRGGQQASDLDLGYRLDI